MLEVNTIGRLPGFNCLTGRDRARCSLKEPHLYVATYVSTRGADLTSCTAVAELAGTPDVSSIVQIAGGPVITGAKGATKATGEMLTGARSAARCYAGAGPRSSILA